MLFIPRFLWPEKSLIDILRIDAGIYRPKDISNLIKSVDVYKKPLPLVFMLACAVAKSDKKQLTKQFAGVLSHERFGNAMNMAAFQKICKLYNKHNIPILALKGLIQKLLYPTSVRPMNDADFAIPKCGYRDAIDLAVQNDFHIIHDMLHSVDLRFRDMGFVDIHYSLFKGSSPKMDDIMFKRAKHLRTMGMDVLIPCPEDIIVIIMCEFYGNFLFEAGSKNVDIKDIFANHPQWVLDAYKIISDNKNLNWYMIMQTAQMSGYDYQIKILTSLLNKIIPGIISKDAKKIINKCCPDCVARKYVKRDKKIINLHIKNNKLYKTGVF